MLRKNIIYFLVSFMIMLVNVTVYSQEGTEPEEPEIELPSVILEFEDLSVENVQTQLPEQLEIEVPEIQFTLPSIEEMPVNEPKLEYKLPVPGIGPEGEFPERNISVEGTLGVGTQNNFYNSIQIYHVKKWPEIRVGFEHGTMDGLGFNPPGKGYSNRNDILDARVIFPVKGMRVSTDNGFKESEMGLQEKGSYFSRIVRSFSTDDEIEIKNPEKSTFFIGGFSASSYTFLLTGGTTVETPEKIGEIVIDGRMSLGYEFAKGMVAVEPFYRFRDSNEYPSLTENVFDFSIKTGVELNNRYTFDGRVGFHWNENTGNSFPFEIGLTGYFSEFFNTTLKGGFRSEPQTLNELMWKYPLIFPPSSLEENRGFFIQNQFSWVPYPLLTLNGVIELVDNSAILDLTGTRDQNTGLFTTTQNEIMGLSISLQSKWQFLRNYTLRGGLKTNLISHPSYVPDFELTAEVIGKEEKGKYGGSLSIGFESGINDFVQAPEVEISGFYRFTRFFTLSVEVGDLLYFFLDGPRYSWYPFVDRGFYVNVKSNLFF